MLTQMSWEVQCKLNIFTFKYKGVKNKMIVKGPENGFHYFMYLPSWQGRLQLFYRKGKDLPNL